MAGVEHLGLRELTKRLPAIRQFLTQRGAELLEPTNEWEVLRFRAGPDTCIVYRNKGGVIRYTGRSAEAIRAFLHGNPWRAGTATRRKSTSPVIRTIRTRDGDDCFACCFPVSFEEESVDHLVEITAGGPNHITNLVLMHIACNQQCAGMSAPEKVRMHVEARMARSA